MDPFNKPNPSIPKTILIIDDEEPIRVALGSYIKSEGFNIIDADNGLVGLQIALKSHPDLILLDLMMPQMDGLTVLTKLQEDQGWGKFVPVIILTNLSDDEKIAQAVSLGARGYLVKKDWRADKVSSLIKQTLGIE